LLRHLKPYWLHIYLLTYLPFLLLADSHVTAQWQQWLLGALTFGVLYLGAMQAPKEQRTQVWVCVGVATGFEIFASLIWGLYRYRMHNLPLFVPPGHGLVYLFGLLAARTPVVMRHGRRVAYVALAGATIWATAGLTVLPAISGRFDVQGALWLPLFAWFVLLSPRWALFAGIFVATGVLEIVGTSLGNWYWMPVAPWIEIPSGNPPSAIVGGYCIIDASVLIAMKVFSLSYERVGLNTIITRIKNASTPSTIPRITPRDERLWNSAEVTSPASASLT
jgi:hypothetical protein